VHVVIVVVVVALRQQLWTLRTQGRDAQRCQARRVRRRQLRRWVERW
jgi:hypothetical protein